MGSDESSWPALKSIDLDMAWAKWVNSPLIWTQVQWPSALDQPIKFEVSGNIPGQPMKEVGDDD